MRQLHFDPVLAQRTKHYWACRASGNFGNCICFHGSILDEVQRSEEGVIAKLLPHRVLSMLLQTIDTSHRNLRHLEFAFATVPGKGFGPHSAYSDFINPFELAHNLRAPGIFGRYPYFSLSEVDLVKEAVQVPPSLGMSFDDKFSLYLRRLAELVLAARLGLAPPSDNSATNTTTTSGTVVRDPLRFSAIQP